MKTTEVDSTKLNLLYGLASAYAAVASGYPLSLSQLQLAYIGLDVSKMDELLSYFDPLIRNMSKEERSDILKAFVE